jgi:hypothetical protein
VICLEDAVLVGAELFELGLEDLIVLVGNGLFVQNEHIRYIIIVNLRVMLAARATKLEEWRLPFPLDL